MKTYPFLNPHLMDFNAMQTYVMTGKFSSPAGYNHKFAETFLRALLEHNREVALDTAEQCIKYVYENTPSWIGPYTADLPEMWDRFMIWMDDTFPVFLHGNFETVYRWHVGNGIESATDEQHVELKLRFPEIFTTKD